MQERAAGWVSGMLLQVGNNNAVVSKHISPPSPPLLHNTRAHTYIISFIRRNAAALQLKRKTYLIFVLFSREEKERLYHQQTG